MIDLYRFSKSDCVTENCLFSFYLGSCFLWINLVMFTTAIDPTRQSKCVTNEHILQVAVFNSEQTPRYTSTFLYSLRTSAGRPDFEHLDKLRLMHYRGTRAGSHVRMPRERFKKRNSVYNECYPDELGCIRRVESTFRIPRHSTPPKARVLTDCMKYTTHSTPGHNVVNINISSALFNAPSVYIMHQIYTRFTLSLCE